MNHLENGTIAVGAPNSIMRFITQHPEPEEPIHDYHVRKSTPWGAAQSASYYGDGLAFYSTASHGGFKVGPKLLKRIPDYLQIADKYAPGTAGWFEEDCAWAIVCVCLPERFKSSERDDAIRIMRHFFPTQWERLCSACFSD